MKIIEQYPDNTSYIDKGLGVGSLVPTSYTNYDQSEGVDLGYVAPRERESFNSKSNNQQSYQTTMKSEKTYVPKVYESFSKQETSPYYECNLPLVRNI
mgnify:CR=1 FL=1